MHWTAYIVVFVFLATAASSLLLGGASTWILPLVAFGLIPLAELMLEPNRRNKDEEEMAAVGDNPIHDWLVILLVPLQWALVLFFVWRVSAGDYQGWELLGAIGTTAICCGTFGINVGHELGHRRKLWEQNLAKVALASSMYMHFFIEHNRGHHVRVATEDDPASSRRGELLYGFWVRSVVGGFISAWKIENTRLRRRKLPVVSLQNGMVRYTLIQSAIVVTLFLAFGGLATASFLLAALGGALLLETVNYVEHYGLQRARTPKGRYERVLPAHSWNSDHPIGRALLLELTRHSDHHANPNRPFTALRSMPTAPQLPTGYPGMVMLALCPPAFFAVMNPRIPSVGLS